MRKFLLVAAVMALLPFAAGSGKAAVTKGGIEYVSVPNPDGSTTEIAVQAHFPAGYVAGTELATLVEVEGYGGASSPNDAMFLDDPDYVVLAVSLRGTGCSAGQLELFSDQSSKDVAWIIENWIPQKTWSNDKVGIYGHSYGGLTGFLAASYVQDTTILKAVAVSGLIDDFYRGILYPGGISNYGFPVLWGAGVRPLGEHQGNASYMTDAHCAANYADHRGSSTVPPPQITLDTYGSPFAKDPVTGADTWSIKQALLTHAGGIKAPIQLGQQYQDEQTGPRGGHVLWENLPAGVPKRIQISTGRHNPNDPARNKKAWLDCYILNEGNPNSYSKAAPAKNQFPAAPAQYCGDVMDQSKKVLLYFESEGYDRVPYYTASEWPLPETDWQRYKLCADRSLVPSASATAACDGEVSYLSTSLSRHMTLDEGQAVPNPAPLAPVGFTTGLPDTARYSVKFTETTVLAGPLEMSLWATLSSPDNNFWAEILDRDTVTGATTFVQRGLLRAAAAADNGGYVPAKSQYAAGHAGDPDYLYRPYYNYLALTPVVPGTPTKYEIEIFPLGHVWRANHELVLQLHAPPANDPISTYAFLPTTPSVVTILQDAAHPTTILFPFLHGLGQQYYRATQPACGAVWGEVCITPALG